ncbi:hypothetical protein NE865_07416 [Phthorimaea operculella]|nr:hypothetical protein NE865_07416 [Phthorimaea operculella]
MQRSRHTDSLQGFMSSFKQFEKKLDKLQSDVSFHGKTLSELRALVANLSGANKTEESKQSQKKTMSSQCESLPARRPEAIRPLKAKSFQGRNCCHVKPAQQFLQPKKGSLPAVTTKHHPRPNKAQAPRKATTLRPQKALEQKNRHKTVTKQ